MGGEDLKISIIAKLDKKGSEVAKCWHYIIGKPMAEVSGGIYIDKEMINPPDFIEIEIPQVKGE
jgi:hypothetical protein